MQQRALNSQTIFLHQSNDQDSFIFVLMPKKMIKMLNKLKKAPEISLWKIKYVFHQRELKWSVFLLFVELDLGNCFSLFFQLLTFFKVSFSHLFEVFFEKYFSLLTVFSFFSFLEDVFDMFFKMIWVANINEFQCVFNSDAPSSSNIVH